MPDDYVIARPSAGIGMQAAGTSLAGLGVPATIVAVPEPSTGSRYLNPVTRDWEVDPATSQMAQMPSVRQRVLIALLTDRGSATASPGLGVRYPDKIGKAFEAEVRHSVRSALAHLTLEDDPVIRIDQIKVERLWTGRILVTLTFTDLETGAPDQVQV